MEYLTSIAESLWRLPRQIWLVVFNLRWYHIIDILIMTSILYEGYTWFRGTRAMRVFLGIAFLGLLFLVAKNMGLFLTSWLLGGVWAAALLFVIVIFQVEIRDILERMNPRMPMGLLRGVGQAVRSESREIVAQAVFDMAQRRVGALLVFERNDDIEPLLRSPGTVLNAELSPELIESLFIVGTPLHDGAVYIRGDVVYRAGCVLPLSTARHLPSYYGTRHRAAMGISEESDALVVAVSEERGTVSVFERAVLQVLPRPVQLVEWLTDRLDFPESYAETRWAAFKSMCVHNWRPKLVSLTAVLLVWFFLVGKQDTEVGLRVPVVHNNLPSDRTIDDNQVRQVYVRIRGSSELVNLLNRSNLRVAVDLKNNKSMIQQHAITAADINLPLGIELIDVYPSTLWLTLREKPKPPTEAKKNSG